MNKSSRRLVRAAVAVPLLMTSQFVSPVIAQASQAPSTSSALTKAEIAALSGAATDHVIIQLTARPTDGTDPAHMQKHAAEVSAAQKGVLAELRSVGAQDVKTFKLLPAVAATVSSAEAQHLAQRPDVASVTADKTVPVKSTAPAAPSSPAKASPTAPPTGAGGTTACSADPTKPVQDEYLSTMHVGSSSSEPQTARALGIDGTGVKVGFIADAIDVNNPDFIRADGSHVVVDTADFTGSGYTAPTNGAEAYIDSSAIAAQGRFVHDVGTYGPLAAGAGKCYVQVQGVAPGASVVALNVFGNSNSAYNSTIAQAIDYATYTDKVDVLNESFGGNPFPDTGATDLTRQANDNAVAAGITVVTSTGDAGISNTQGSPSTDPLVIAAGATTTYQLFKAIGYGGAPFAPGGYESDNISTISSSGVDQDGRTFDVLAPGELNWSSCTADRSRFSGCTNYSGAATNTIAGGGTSQSSPLTAGTAALVIQAYAQSHGGTKPTPAMVKQIITSTAADVHAPADIQGAGEVDAYRAALAAEGAGNALVVSSSQLNAIDGPSQVQNLTETVTNTSDTRQTLSLSTRTLGSPTTIASGSVTLSDSSSPKIEDYTGRSTNYQGVDLTVPAGADRLVVDIAYNGGDPFAFDLTKRVRLTLVDPSGNLASYDLPQGNGNHDYAQVTDPAPGAWKAYIWSRQSIQGGTVGTVLYRAQVASFTTFGTVSPASVSLRPGQSRDVRVRVSTPDAPGDQAGSLVITTDEGASFARTSTVPVILRTLASVTRHEQSTFGGTVLGGNGRSYFTGQSAYYQFDVSGALRALNADVVLQGSPDSTFFAELIDPTGNAVSVASNTLLSGAGSANQNGTQLHVLRPAAGRWTLAFDFYNQVAGTSLDQPYTVTLNGTQVPVNGSALPKSEGFRLAPGSTLTVPVTVTNNGSSPEEYYVDARTDATAIVPLVAYGSSQVNLPSTPGVPGYVVPSHTRAVAWGASASRPVFAEASFNLGDPDLRVGPATMPIGVYAPPARDVSDGFWFVAPSLQGPFPDGGTTPVTADTAMTALTQGFDPGVTAPTGDLWAASTDPTAGFAPVVVPPGSTVTIPVTITAAGTSGTNVHGTLYVASAQLGAQSSIGQVLPESSDVAALRYAYRVK